MFRFSFVSLALLLALGASAGCGSRGKAPDSSVSGKVTFGGRAVTGQVVFVGSDKKEIAAPISPEGAYQINNPPAGEYQVVVKGVPGAPVVPGAKPPADPSAPPPAGTAPPPRYAQPNNGLKFSVTGGEQKYDIELK